MPKTCLENGVVVIVNDHNNSEIQTISDEINFCESVHGQMIQHIVKYGNEQVKNLEHYREMSNQNKLPGESSEYRNFTFFSDVTHAF